MGFFFLRIAHIALFYTINFFFLIPRGICVIIRPVRSLAQPCSVTTPFLASGKAKNGVFSLRIAHIALFYTITYFF